jgi:hypothetical protein
MAMSSRSFDPRVQTFWSPYYKVNYIKDGNSREITTNNIGHQGMVSVEQGGPAYALPHLLNRDAGRPAFQDVLIIGAGSGNDVQAARSFGAGHIDAVEIDPVLNEIGRREHPNQPYSDPRVSIHLDDGRSFSRKRRRNTTSLSTPWSIHWCCTRAIQVCVWKAFSLRRRLSRHQSALEAGRRFRHV